MWRSPKVAVSSLIATAVLKIESTLQLPYPTKSPLGKLFHPCCLSFPTCNMHIVVAAGLTVEDVIQGGAVFSMIWLFFSPQLNGYSNIERHSGEKHT